jgi:hypothetical protein
VLTASNQFEGELKKRLHDRMLEIAEILTAGQAVKDFETYQRYVGEFRAYKQVVDIHCDEVNTTINQR